MELELIVAYSVTAAQLILLLCGIVHDVMNP